MNLIKRARFTKGKTQIQIFKKTDIWPSRLSYIENGFMKANEKEKEKLAKVLGVKKSWLFPNGG